jgi:hypothetical protein
MPFIHRKATEKLIADFKKGDNKNANLVWRIANLNFWIKANQH